MTGYDLYKEGDGTDIIVVPTGYVAKYFHADGSAWHKGPDLVEHADAGLTDVTASGDASLQVATSGTTRTLTAGSPTTSLLTTASKGYTQADRGKTFRRANSGAAMTDSLPALNDTTDVGYTLTVHNKGTAVAETVTFTATSATFEGSGTSTYVQQFGTRQTFVWAGSTIGWLFGAGNSNLARIATSANTAGDVPQFADTTGRLLQDAVTDYGVGGKKIVNLATPTSNSDAATKAYVDQAAVGVTSRHQAVTVFTANVAITGLPGANDGVTASAGQVVLLTSQSTSSQNGQWVVASGAWTRPTYFAAGSDATGSYVMVESGTTYAGSEWQIIGVGPITVDTTAQSWVEPTGTYDITVDGTLAKTGNQLSRVATTGDVVIPAGSNAATIQALAVTLAKMAQVPAHSYIGNNSGSLTGAAYVTSTQITADLNVATASLQGLLKPSHFAFISAIDGAVLIDVQANDYSNLKCDGATDDLAALNALMTAAPDGSTLQWPLQNSTMVLTDHAVIPGGKHFNFVGGEDGKTNWLQTNPTADHITAGDWYSTFTGINYLTINTTTTASQALTSGTVLTVTAIPNLTNVAASGSITVGSTAGWQVLTYSARTSTTVTLSQTGTGSTVIGVPLVFKTAGTAINAGNFVGIDAINCATTCCYNGYVASGSTANSSLVSGYGGLNCINFDVQIDAANWNGEITDCTADCTVNSRTVCHLEINQCGAITGQNNQWIRGQYDMRLGSTTAAYPAGVFSIYFNNCFYDNAGIDAVKIQGISAVQRVKLTDSWLSSAQTGMGLNLASTASTLPTDINLANCNIYSNAVNGVGGNGSQDINIVNCQIAGNGTAGVNSFCPKVHVSDCRIGPVGGIGANGTGIILPAGAYTTVQIHDNDMLGNTTALTDSSTSITNWDVYRNAGLLTGRSPNVAATAIALTTVTNCDSRGGLPFPINARPGSKLRAIYEMSSAATIQTFTPVVKFGTANSNADATICPLTSPAAALAAGTAVVGGGRIVVEMTILTATTAHVTMQFQNSLLNTGMSATNVAAGGADATITTSSQAYFSLYASSATAAAVTCRSVVYEVVSQ